MGVVGVGVGVSVACVVGVGVGVSGACVVAVGVGVSVTCVVGVGVGVGVSVTCVVAVGVSVGVACIVVVGIGVGVAVVGVGVACVGVGAEGPRHSEGLSTTRGGEGVTSSRLSGGGIDSETGSSPLATNCSKSRRLRPVMNSDCSILPPLNCRQDTTPSLSSVQAMSWRGTFGDLEISCAAELTSTGSPVRFPPSMVCRKALPDPSGGATVSHPNGA